MWGEEAGTPVASADFAADPAALKEAAEGLVTAMTELQSISGAVDGDIGMGFEDIALSGLQLGSEGLRATLAEFGSRWSWGVRQLFDEGNEFAGLLGLSARAVHDNEQYVMGTFKDLMVDGYGNPYESNEDAEKHSLKWSLSQDVAPDESSAQAKEHIKDTAKAAVADEIRSSPGGYIIDRLSGGRLSHDTQSWVPQQEASAQPDQGGTQ
ncbi:hypothetical protein ACWGCW_36480 [Streptomyces sp. NPDC054933]